MIDTRTSVAAEVFPSFPADGTAEFADEIASGLRYERLRVRVERPKDSLVESRVKREIKVMLGMPELEMNAKTALPRTGHDAADVPCLMRGEATKNVRRNC